MTLTRFNFENNLHQFGTGLPILNGFIVSGQSFVNDSTGVYIHVVDKWNSEWVKRAYSCTSTGVYSGVFTGGYIR